MAKQWIALLDKKGLLLGFEKDPTEIPEGAVTVPEGCDLAPGGYRWTGTTFWPIEKSDKLRKEKLFRKLPECFYLMMVEMQKQKIIIPEKVVTWLEEYASLFKK
jgi:hypothetical protein